MLQALIHLKYSYIKWQWTSNYYNLRIERSESSGLQTVFEHLILVILMHCLQLQMNAIHILGQK